MAASRIERKLSAILYADVAGYSRLTGVDEEGTHRRLSTYLDVVTAAVETHGGRVVHYAGDAVLADFSSVVDAVTCAMVIQADLRERNATLPADRRVEFRIGINLGEVMVDRNDIYGEGVNVAARLEGLAEAGGICVSGAVFDQVHDRIDAEFQSLGRQRVKNIAQPVTAYRLLQNGERPSLCAKPGLWRRIVAGKRLVVLVLAAVIAGALAATVLVTATLGPPDTAPSVTVMPFRVIGEVGPTEFGEGLSEDLVTELTKRTSLRVAVPPSDVGTAGHSDLNGLQARYRVEGTVRVAEERVRITVQLVSIENGYHLWGARYDRAFVDTLAIQAEVATRIASNLEERLARAEADRTAAGMSVTEIVMRGFEQIGRVGERAISHVVDVYDRVFGGGGDA